MLNGYFVLFQVHSFFSKCNGSKLVSTLSFVVVGAKAGVLHSSKRIKRVLLKVSLNTILLL